MEVANLNDLRNVKFGVEKLGQKVCRSSIHGSKNPAVSTTIQLRQHDNDAEEEQKMYDTRRWQHSE